MGGAVLNGLSQRNKTSWGACVTSLLDELERVINQENCRFHTLKQRDREPFTSKGISLPETISNCESYIWLEKSKQDLLGCLKRIKRNLNEHISSISEVSD